MYLTRTLLIRIIFKVITLTLLVISLADRNVLALAGNDQRMAGSEQRFAMEPQDQTAIVGSRVTLPCRVIGKQGALQWTKDDFGLGTFRNLSGFERYSMVGSDEEGDFSLDIYPVMLDDDARYQCQVGPGPQGQPGIRSRFASLTILVPPEPPKIVQGDYLLTTEDREIELECVSVGGKPAAEITWIDGLGNVLITGIDYVKEPLPDSRRFTAKSILKLTPKKEHHNTSFTCQAQNTADRTYRSVKLKLEVKYAPKVSVSVIGGTVGGGRILEGSEVRLSCKADANPSTNITYKWFINDEHILADYTTEMIIRNVSRKYHDAIVKCEVHNAVGKSEESETLDISYGPIFKIKPKSVEADIGSTVLLSCDVDGNPPADILWIHETYNRVVGTSGNLTITVTQDTAGRYYCKASVMGFAEIVADAMIHLKAPPRISSSNRQTGTSGDYSRIECVAFSVPKARHVSWTYNGREINPNNNPDYSILEEPAIDGIKSTLIIRLTSSEHFGRYNCTVVNDYGNDILEIDLIRLETNKSMYYYIAVAVVLCLFIGLTYSIFSLCQRNKKKLPPADLIPSHHHKNVKNFKDSDRTSNFSETKVDIAAEVEYSETGSAKDSITTKTAANHLSMMNDYGEQNSSGTIGGYGIPLAGAVPIRLSGDFNDMFSKTNSGLGPNNNKNVQDYSLDIYQRHPDMSTVLNQRNVTGSGGGLIGPPNQYHFMNGQIPGSNLSLTRNRNELKQNNGLPVMHPANYNSLQNGHIGSSTIYNTTLNTIDPRYCAAYGNVHLRTSNQSLPPLPPPSTANPAATPAPPPYNATRSTTNTIMPTSSTGTTVLSGNSTSTGTGGGTIIGLNSSMGQSIVSPQLTSPSGQMILPTNSNFNKKGTTQGTHV